MGRVEALILTPTKVLTNIVLLDYLVRQLDMVG